MSKSLSIFIPSLEGGGAEKLMLALGAQIAAQGVFDRVDLVVANSKGSLAESVPASLNLVNLCSRTPIRGAFRLAAYLRRARPWCLLSTVQSANVTALLSQAITQSARKVVICEANPTEFDLSEGSPSQRFLTKALIKTLYRRADLAIAISADVRWSLKHVAGVGESRIVTIPNPLLADHVATPRSDTVLSRQRSIIACGRLQPQKDFPTLLRAFAIVRESTDVKLRILGEGPALPDLLRLADLLGIGQHVEFLGYVGDPRRAMATATVFAHTARWEGFGLVLLEALASGCRVVATNCRGGVREVLEGGRFGRLVETGNPAEIASAILEALDDDQPPPDGLAEHLAKYSLESIALKYIDVLI